MYIYAFIFGVCAVTAVCFALWPGVTGIAIVLVAFGGPALVAPILEHVVLRPKSR
jgi:hypothetical protein